MFPANIMSEHVTSEGFHYQVLMTRGNRLKFTHTPLLPPPTPYIISLTVLLLYIGSTTMRFSPKRDGIPMPAAEATAETSSAHMLCFSTSQIQL